MPKAPSRRIRIIFNLSGFKNFLVLTYRIQIEFACPHASDGIWIHSGETRPTRCATIFVYCSGREWSGFAMSGSKISRFALRTSSASLRFQLFFSTLESRFKNIQICCRIRRMRVDGSRIWEEKVADPTISRDVWTGLKSCSSVCLGLSYL